jgi:thioredoxin 1
MLGPILEDVEREVGDSAVVAKVNVDDEPDLAVKFGVSNIPTMILFRKGETLDRTVGLIPKDKIVALIKSHA